MGVPWIYGVIEIGSNTHNPMRIDFWLILPCLRTRRRWREGHTKVVEKPDDAVGHRRAVFPLLRSVSLEAVVFPPLLI